MKQFKVWQSESTNVMCNQTKCSLYGITEHHNKYIIVGENGTNLISK